MKPATVAFRMARLDLVVRQLLPGQILPEQLVVVLDGGLDQLVPRRLHPLAIRLGHRHLGERLAERLVVEDDLDATEHVDVPGEHLACADGELQRIRLLGETIADHGEAAVEVRADPVHLVGEDQPGNTVPVGLAPDGLGLRFDTGDGVEKRDGAVEHAERALDLDGEVDVPRRVDDVDPVQGTVAVPEAGRGGGGDRDAPLLLLLHPVHGGGALMDLTDLVVLAGVIQDALGRRRLPGIDVGHDADVAIAVERGFAGHVFSVSISEKAGRPTRASRWYRSAHIRAEPRMRGSRSSPRVVFGGPEVAEPGGESR